MNHRFHVVLIAIALCGAWDRAAIAQNTPAQNAPATAPALNRVVAIQNVPPRWMAWWLDPQHNQKPAEFDTPQIGKVGATPPEEAKTKGAFELPAGVQSVAPIEQQRALLVFGTEAGIAELQKTIAFLDQPLRQIEIEAQFVQIGDEDARTLGVDFGTRENAAAPSAARQGLQIGFLRGNFQEKLSQLVAQNKAKIRTQPRVTALNNLAASLRSFSARPAIVGFKNEAGQTEEIFGSSAQKDDSPLSIGTEFRFSVTPTINNDETVTLLLSPSTVLKIGSDNQKQEIVLRELSGFLTIVNVRDGDTVALAGLDSRFFATLKDDDKTPIAPLLVLVTARIVRHAGEEIRPVALTSVANWILSDSKRALS